MMIGGDLDSPVADVLSDDSNKSRDRSSFGKVWSSRKANPLIQQEGAVAQLFSEGMGVSPKEKEEAGFSASKF